jgi:hypothetical protein
MDTPPTPDQAKHIIDWLTVFALFGGPIAAVFITRFVDGSREVRQRKLLLFRTLMKTRGTRLHYDHVGALNLVEIEFYKERRVLDALERYFQHLNDSSSPNNWQQKSNHLFTKLLSEMARALGYEIEQLQILTGGYAPQGWETTEKRVTMLQEKLNSLLDGNISLSITNKTNNAAPKFIPPEGFPPPPT